MGCSGVVEREGEVLWVGLDVEMETERVLAMTTLRSLRPRVGRDQEGRTKDLWTCKCLGIYPFEGSNKCDEWLQLISPA
jgi:hypothetical protein